MDAAVIQIGTDSCNSLAWTVSRQFHFIYDRCESVKPVPPDQIMREMELLSYFAAFVAPGALIDWSS